MISAAEKMLQRSSVTVFRASLTALLLASGLLGLTACGPGRPTLLSGSVMGTTWSVQIVGSADTDLERSIQAQLDEINGRMSTYSEHSELSRFNDNASTDWVAVSPELARVVAEALRVAVLTAGAFDITAAPLVDLWGFGPNLALAELPTEAAVVVAMARLGFDNLGVQQSPPALRKSRANLSVDLSAIAKGYAVDQVATLLERRGVRDYLVEIGGELRARGHNARGESWTIGVEQPRPEDRRVQRTFPLYDLAVATSGDYRNFYDRDGRRFSHIIDPRTGYPVEHRLASVTVLDTSAMSADAYATGLLVLGEEAGFEFAVRHDIGALFVLRDAAGFSERLTPAFERLTRKGE
jgi:thiamine biosynthesis lipoprotein